MKIVYLFILILIPVMLDAQQFFTQGKIIVAKGDTLYGLIDSRGEVRNTRICSYKENKNSDLKEFKPFEIEGYSYNHSGRYFVSRQVFIDSVENELFVEFILDGIINLFSYRDISGYQHYLIEMPDGEMVELTNEETNFMDKGLEFARTSNKYKGVLKAAFRDTPGIYTEIDRMEFRQSDMIRVITEYHKAKGLEDQYLLYEKIPETRNRSLTVYADYSFVKGKLYGSNPDADCIFKLTGFYGAGAFLEFLPIKYNGKYYVRVGLSGTKQIYVGLGESTNIGLTSYYDMNIEMQSIGIPVSAGIYFPLTKIKFYTGINITPMVGKIAVENLSWASYETEEEKDIHEASTFDDFFAGTSLSIQGGFY